MCACTCNTMQSQIIHLSIASYPGPSHFLSGWEGPGYEANLSTHPGMILRWTCVLVVARTDCAKTNHDIPIVTVDTLTTLACHGVIEWT